MLYKIYKLQYAYYRTVAGSLQYFKFLEVLNLSNNNIKDLDAVLSLLQKNRYLKELCKKFPRIVSSPHSITLSLRYLDSLSP